jgi:acetone carboxylase gamma subunit
MKKVLEYLEIVSLGATMHFRCAKCQTVLCRVTEDYKNYALKNDAPISKGEPDYLAFKSDQFLLREYYCPICGVMFEVDMVARDEKQIHTVELKVG